MARIPSKFNASEADKLGDYTPIPAGVYVAEIVESAIKDTKLKDGKYLELKFRVMSGDYTGKPIFVRLNIQNQNTTTVEIAEKTLATICECAGVDMLEDSEQLHGIPMNINVIVKEAQAQYPAQNEVRGYSPYDGSEPAPSKAPAATTAPKSTPPWKR